MQVALEAQSYIEEAVERIRMLRRQIKDAKEEEQILAKEVMAYMGNIPNLYSMRGVLLAEISEYDTYRFDSKTFKRHDPRTYKTYSVKQHTKRLLVK